MLYPFKPDLFMNLTDTVINLLCNLHISIFFVKLRFLLFFLNVTKKNSVKLTLKGRADLTRCLLCCDGFAVKYHSYTHHASQLQQHRLVNNPG